MIVYFLMAAALILAVAAKYVFKGGETCPECGQARHNDHPICACGWVFEYPDDTDPLEYGDPEDNLEDAQ